MFAAVSTGIFRPSATLLQAGSAVLPVMRAAWTAIRSDAWAPALVLALSSTGSWYSSGGCTCLME
jgi:hypothetical protein